VIRMPREKQRTKSMNKLTIGRVTIDEIWYVLRKNDIPQSALDEIYDILLKYIPD